MGGEARGAHGHHGRVWLKPVRGGPHPGRLGRGEPAGVGRRGRGGPGHAPQDRSGPSCPDPGAAKSWWGRVCWPLGLHAVPVAQEAAPDRPALHLGHVGDRPVPVHHPDPQGQRSVLSLETIESRQEQPEVGALTSMGEQRGLHPVFAILQPVPVVVVVEMVGVPGFSEGKRQSKPKLVDDDHDDDNEGLKLRKHQNRWPE